MSEQVARIPDTSMVVNAEGDTMVADLIIENAEGSWYGVDLGGGDWDYLQDNVEYIPANKPAVNAVTRIVWHVNVPDLFDRWEQDDLDSIDRDASADRYVEMVNAALKAAYTDAEVVSRIDRNATGWCPEPTVELGDGSESDIEASYVQDIIGRVYSNADWQVSPPRLHPTSFRLSPSAHRKLDALAAQFGNKTTVVEMAIDRMYRDEIH